MSDKAEVSHLDCADAEQTWISTHLAQGFNVPRLALIDYARPTLIYGRRGGESAGTQARAASLGYGLQRRRSGGGAVLAGPWMLGVNLLLPATHRLGQLSHVEAFRWFGSCWQQVLSELGLPSELADGPSIGRHDSARDSSGLDWVCFAGLSHGELLDGNGRKVLGLAQYRGRWGALLSAGLLLADTPWEQLEFIHLGQRPERSAMHQLTAAVTLQTPAREQLRNHLTDHLQRALAS